VTDAVCRVKATSNNPAPVSGSFTFNAPTSNAAVDPGDGETVLTTSYSLNGLTDGDHKYHVHNFGDVFAPDGTSVENHFIGNTHTRPASGLQEVGLLNDGAPVQSPDGGGQASGSFPDSSADLNGINSILGRAVVIHGTLSPNPLTKATQCVIGWNGDSTTKIREVHEITRTSCFLEPTQGSIYPNLQGDVQFEVNEFGSVDVRVFVTLGSGSDRSDFSLQINQAGNILTPDGSGQTSIFTGTPLNPLAARTAIGQVGGGATAWTFSSTGLIIQKFITDFDIDLNGVNSVVARGLVLKAGSSLVAQCVIGISRDDTFNEPIQPDNLDNTAPFMILEAQAMLSPCGGTVAGYIGFRRLASTDANYPGVWVRYYLTGLTNGQSYVFQIRTAGAFSATPGTQDGASATTDAGPLFNGYYPGREIGLNSVGAVNNGFNFTASGTTARGEFVDRSLWLSDYNSIIGRSAAVLVAGGVDLLSYGVIGITRESSSQRDYPGPQVLTGECFLPGIGKLTLTQGAGLSISGPSVSGPVAFGVGTQGDIFDASAGGYLFKGTSTASGCSASFNGNLGSANGAISITNNANLALRGVNSIIGRTLFISTTDSYFRSGPARWLRRP